MRKELRQRWVNAGYPRVIGSAEVVPPPSSEFIRVYHLTSADYAVSNIGLRRLKVARFADLNDPFELLSLNFREHRARKIVRSFKDRYGADTGLLCFSSNWTNPVLWSHYGSNHRGICLGFDIGRAHAQTVRYEDSRRFAKLDDVLDPLTLPDDLQQLLLCTKFSHWRYEQEVRVFVPLQEAKEEGNLHFVSFDRPDLRLAEVILGPECTFDLEGVRALVNLQYRDAVTFKARLAFKTFDVVPKESTVP